VDEGKDLPKFDLTHNTCPIWNTFWPAKVRVDQAFRI
jgi:hypothetical protein